MITEQRKQELMQIAQQIKSGQMSNPLDQTQQTQGILPPQGISSGLANSFNFAIGRTSTPYNPIQEQVKAMVAAENMKNSLDPLRQIELAKYRNISSGTTLDSNGNPIQDNSVNAQPANVGNVASTNNVTSQPAQTNINNPQNTQSNNQAGFTGNKYIKIPTGEYEFDPLGRRIPKFKIEESPEYKTYQATTGKESALSTQNFSQLNSLIGNLASSLKSANIQQGGGGPLRGLVGNIAVGTGQSDTGNIYALQNVRRDTAMKLAHMLTGGSQGAVRMFQNIIGSIPSNTKTSEQSGSALAELYFTASALKDGLSKKGLSAEEISKLSSKELQSIADEQKMSYTESENANIYQGLSDMLKSSAPRSSIDLEGNIKQPTINPLSKSLGFGKVKMLGIDGKQYTVDQGEVDEAIQNGWKKI